MERWLVLKYNNKAKRIEILSSVDRRDFVEPLIAIIAVVAMKRECPWSPWPLLAWRFQSCHFAHIY